MQWPRLWPGHPPENIVRFPSTGTRILNDGLLSELQEAVGDAYDIERELGGGGMSRVFLAAERSLGRRVVIKVLPPDLVSGVSEARFQREILVTANLQHPHILPVLAAGARGDLHYYVTPYVEGQSLREHLAFMGALSVADGLQILRELAGALAHAHSRGIIHRDVKPENVLLSEGHAVLADFGIAGATLTATHEERLTRTGQGPGTPGYMAPEQLVDAAAADARVDVFALGVVGYEIFAGKPPFSGPTPRELAAAYFGDAPPSLDVPGLPANVANAIARAMSTAPEERFATAGELLDAIKPALDEVAPVGRNGRRRSRMLGAALVVIALSATALLWRGLGSRAGGGDTADLKVVAVLPFKNLGPPEDAYFADGVTEEVTSRLATVAGLGVISRTSADQYAASTKPLRTIARELGADYVLEGSVRWERSPDGAGRVRVTPQLIRVRDDTHVWANQFNAELKDVFSVQSDIAEQVARALEIALPGEQRRRMGAQLTTSLAAYDAYIKGEQVRVHEGTSPAGLKRAEELFTQAIAADPRFALAWARLALVHVRAYESFTDRSVRRLNAARDAADSAFAIDPGLPESRVARGRYFDAIDDLEHAGQEYAIAEQGRPNDSDILSLNAQILARHGAWEDATRRLQRAARLDPLSVRANTDAAVAFGYQRDYPRALDYVERAIVADSDAIESQILKARLQLLSSPDWSVVRATAREIMQRFGVGRAAASEEFDLVLPALDSTDLATLERVDIADFSGNPVVYYYWRVELFERWRPERARAYADTLTRMAGPMLREEPNSFRLLSAVGYLWSILGQHDASIEATRKALQLAPRERDATAWAAVASLAAQAYVRLGDLDAALDELEEVATAPSWISVPLLLGDPLWSPLKPLPRFQRLVARGS